MIILALALFAQEHALYKSTDRGLSWTKSDAGITGNPRINAIGAIGASGATLLAGTDAGVFRSVNQGRTWQKAGTSSRILSFAASSEAMFAGTHRDGLLESRDAGATWTAVGTFAPRNVRSLHAPDNQTLYAGTGADGVLRSRDQGKSWTAINAGLPPLSQIFAIASADSTVFVALYAKGLYSWNEADARWTKAGDVKPLVLASSDGTLAAGHNPGGLHWSAKPNCPLWNRAYGDFDIDAPVWEMAAAPGGLVLAGMADGIYRSENHGKTWSRTQSGLPAKSPGVSFLIQGKTIYAGVFIPSYTQK